MARARDRTRPAGLEVQEVVQMATSSRDLVEEVVEMTTSNGMDHHDTEEEGRRDHHDTASGPRSVEMTASMLPQSSVH